MTVGREHGDRVHDSGVDQDGATHQENGQPPADQQRPGQPDLKRHCTDDGGDHGETRHPGAGAPSPGQPRADESGDHSPEASRDHHTGYDSRHDVDHDLTPPKRMVSSTTLTHEQQPALTSQEEVLRQLLRDTVQDLSPSPMALERLRRAVPTRRARRRQALIGAAASVILAFTAIPALVHTATTTNTSTERRGSTEVQHSDRGGEHHAESDPTRGPGESPSGKEARKKKDKGKEPKQPVKPSGKASSGASAGSPPSRGEDSGASTCLATHLAQSAPVIGQADSDGKVYGSFRVVNTSQTSCSVGAPGDLVASAQGSADGSRIQVAAHTPGGPATSLPTASDKQILLQPGSAYVLRFGWVPESGTTGCGTSSEPMADGGSTSDSSSTEAGASEQSGQEEAPQEPPGSVALTYTPAAGGPSASGQIDNVCAGTVYYMGPVAAGYRSNDPADLGGGGAGGAVPWDRPRCVSALPPRYRGDVYRFLLTPRWLGITLLTLLAIPICLLMGTWQLGRFEDRVNTHREAERRPSSTASAVPLADVLGDGSSRQAARDAKVLGIDDVGKAVVATGRYDAARQLIIPDRSLDGRRGYYVLTPLRTEGERALPVVRGWHEGEPPKEAPAPPSGEVSARGVLQAPESTGADGGRAVGGLPEGQLAVISASALVNRLPYPVYDAWITLAEGDSAGEGMTPVPPSAPEVGGLDLKAFQNLGYSGEWFVFAGFVAFMWFRLFRRDAEIVRDRALGLLVDVTSDAAPGRSSEGAAEALSSLGGPGIRGDGATKADDAAIRAT